MASTPPNPKLKMPVKSDIPTGTNGKKPSETYQHLKSLCANHMPESRLMGMWLNQLPLELQLVLTGLRHLGTDKLIASADIMMEIYEAQTKKPDVYELLLKQRIESLSEKVEKMNQVLMKLQYENLSMADVTTSQI